MTVADFDFVIEAAVTNSVTPVSVIVTQVAWRVPSLERASCPVTTLDETFIYVVCRWHLDAGSRQANPILSFTYLIWVKFLRRDR